MKLENKDKVLITDKREYYFGHIGTIIDIFDHGYKSSLYHKKLSRLVRYRIKIEETVTGADYWYDSKNFIIIEKGKK